MLTRRIVDPATFPSRLNIVNQILLIWIFSVMQDEVSQPISRLVFDPSLVFEYKC